MQFPNLMSILVIPWQLHLHLARLCMFTALFAAQKVNFQLFQMHFSTACLHTSLLSKAITFNELHSAFN